MQAEESEQAIKKWYYHIQAEKIITSPSWGEDFKEAATELDEIVEFTYYPKSIEKFIKGKNKDGFYAYYIFARKNRFLKIFYFQVINSQKYLLSYLQEAVSGKVLGSFAFKTFLRTYPVTLKITQDMAEGNSESGIQEMQTYFSHDYLLGKDTQVRRASISYIDEEEMEIGFQEINLKDGFYTRAWLDPHGKISIEKSITLPEASDNFSVYYYYGHATKIPHELSAYSLAKFRKLALRRTLPITIILLHKKGFYKPCMLQSYVPFEGNALKNIAKLVYLKSGTKYIKDQVLEGEKAKSVKLIRLTSNISLKLLSLKKKNIRRARAGAGKIEIFREDGSRVVYKGMSSFRPARIKNVVIDVGQYVFTYKPFFPHKFIIQKRKVSIKGDTKIVFTPFKRIPYIFYETQKSVYRTLGNAFSKRELKYRIRSFDSFGQLLDFFEQKKPKALLWENFLNTLIEVYEKYKDKIWKQIPPNHPHYISFHFDLAEIYWRRSHFHNPMQNLEKSLRMILREDVKLKDFCKKWYFRGEKIKDIKLFRRYFFSKKPGLLKYIRNKWDRYRVMYCIASILMNYYKNTYEDISDDTCHSFGATIITLTQCFKMKKERTRALGEEHTGLDYNIANMIAETLELTKKRAKSDKPWTKRQKYLISYHLRESESKHVVYSSLSFLEALGEEFRRLERWDLQIIPGDLGKTIVKNCRSSRREHLENFVNEILRKWYKKKNKHHISTESVSRATLSFTLGFNNKHFQCKIGV